METPKFDSSFAIEPHVWDHMNTPLWPLADQAALDDQKSGGMQRISAFMLRRKGTPVAKRTLIVGSAGEMHREHTIPAPAKVSLTCDLLIQAVSGDTIPGVALFDGPLAGIARQSRRFTFRNIAIRDHLVLCHFEKFAQGIASERQFRRDYKRVVKENLEALTEQIRRDRKVKAVNRDLLARKRVFVLKRAGAGFETALPADASGLAQRARRVLASS